MSPVKLADQPIKLFLKFGAVTAIIFREAFCLFCVLGNLLHNVCSYTFKLSLPATKPKTNLDSKEKRPESTFTTITSVYRWVTTSSGRSEHDRSNMKVKVLKHLILNVLKYQTTSKSKCCLPGVNQWSADYQVFYLVFNQLSESVWFFFNLFADRI